MHRDVENNHYVVWDMTNYMGAQVLHCYSYNRSVCGGRVCWSAWRCEFFTLGDHHTLKRASSGALFFQGPFGLTVMILCFDFNNLFKEVAHLLIFLVFCLKD